MNASFKITMSWFVNRGDIRWAREPTMVSDRGGGRSHTFHKRMEIVSDLDKATPSVGGAGSG